MTEVYVNGLRTMLTLYLVYEGDNVLLLYCQGAVMSIDARLQHSSHYSPRYALLVRSCQLMLWSKPSQRASHILIENLIAPDWDKQGFGWMPYPHPLNPQKGLTKTLLQTCQIVPHQLPNIQ